ncbi:MAG: hypothetical protein Q7S95_02225 [bacterium]|nr:hypothetical protein [bacterium]
MVKGIKRNVLVWIILALAIIGAGAFFLYSEVSNKTTDSSAHELDISEGTQGEFGDLRIGLGYTRVADYTDDKGATQHGDTAGLWIYVRNDSTQNRTLDVHEGQSFIVDKYRIFVDNIAVGQHGSVNLLIWESTTGVLTIGGDTQGTYGDLRIGMESNPQVAQVLVNGVPEEDVVAKLWLYVRDRSDEDRTMTVYIGQTFTIDKYKITVEDIKGGRGSIRLSIEELKN